MMRRMVYLAAGFAAACALCAYVTDGQWMKWILLSAGVLALCTGVLCRKHTGMKRACLGLLGVLLGLVWFAVYDRIYYEMPPGFEEGIHSISAQTLDYSYETDHGIAVDGWMNVEGKPYQIRLYLEETEPISPGTTLTGQFRLRLTLPDGAAESLYHQGKGIFLLGYQRGEVIRSEAEPGWIHFPAILRAKIKFAIDRCFPADTVAFAKALLLGDSTDLSYETDTHFKLSGIRHMIAVSGLHVSILFALLSTITFKNRFLTVLLGMPALVLFAAVVGFTPSVTRACLMCGLMLVAMLFDREYDAATALSFSVLVILIANPLTIASVGFQLSVASVAGIFLFEPGLRRWMAACFPEGGQILKFFAKGMTSSFSTSLSAMVLTTPLCTVCFGTVSLVGAVTNLLTLWVISFVFYGILMVCLLSLFWQAGAVWMAWVISWPVRYVLLVAKLLGELPLSALYTRSDYIVIWLVFLYVLLGIFLFGKNKKPAVLVCCAAAGLCMALLASWAEPTLGDVRFTVLDVGQGQCLLIQNQGRNVMIDCGGDSDAGAADTAAETLLSQGITKLDALILTHNDRDHAGGAENLLTRIETDLLILPPEHSELGEAYEGRTVYAAQDLELVLGNANIKIFAPNFPGNSNEMSLCILFATEKCAILVTGDRNGFGERMLLRTADIPDVDILVAGHHGSKHSSCEELLTATRPEIVCISAGEGNSYGHPAPELLERLQNYGCEIYRTDVQGTILIRR